MSVKTAEKRVTIYDVAKKAGVAPSTVSLAINNAPNVRLSTVNKVMDAARLTGYTPGPVKTRQGRNPKSRHPSSYRKMQVALISQMRPFLMETPIYSKVMRGIEAELGECYYNLIIRNLPENASIETIPRKIDGAILFNVNDENPKLLRELRTMPCVRIMGEPRENDFFDHVTYNNSSVGRQAAEYFLKKGHRTVVYLGEKKGSFYSRYHSFASTMENTGVELYGIVEENLLDESNNMQLPNVKEIGKAIEKIKQLPEMPTAIFVPADIITIGLYHTLHHYGIIPGKDIEIIGVNNDAVALNNFTPRPASVDIHPEKVGREAVKRLFWRMDNQKEPLMKIEFEPEIALN